MMTPAAPSRQAEPLSDHDVIAKVLAGDRESFALLVRRYNQRLFRACRAVLANDADAEDAVQAAWISAYRYLASFRGEASFSTWVIRIAVNEASGRLRRRTALAIVADAADSIPDSHTPEHKAMTEQLGRLLEEHLDALPDGMRTVLVLRDVLELDTAETAECLGISPEAVRVRLHRARAALAASMSSLIQQGAGALWQFDGGRCDRVTESVMRAIRGM